MLHNYVRLWDGGAWQDFSLALVQRRHGAANVQRVPDRVKGDGGIEFFTTDGCLYQCYAPEEAANVAKAASAMKAKASRDLGKLTKNAHFFAGLLQGVSAKRWILLCPFLDDRAVVEHVRKKGKELRDSGLPFLDAGFEALVQSQEDFAVEIEALKSVSIGPPIRISEPTEAEVADVDAGEISETLTKKLRKAYPRSAEREIASKKFEHITSSIRRGNTLEDMKKHHPELFEKATRLLASEERRLTMIGADGAAPREQLASSLHRVEATLRRDLPSLSGDVVDDISLGTLSDWLMRCPLDFEGSDQ